MHFLPALASLLLATQQTGGFSHVEDNELIRHSYDWPAEVEADTALRDQLRQEMRDDIEQATSLARFGRDMDQRSNSSPRRRSEVRITWLVAGNGTRLLSLIVARRAAEGGLNSVQQDPLLWDRTDRTSIFMRNLLDDDGATRLQRRYCAAWATLPSTTGEAECRPLDDMVLVPADEDGNGRFETLRVINPLQPDVPRPRDVVTLRFEPMDVAGMDAGLRANFEAQAGSR
jgi:hypothetical protein